MNCSDFPISRTRQYKILRDMKQRCYNKNHQHYQRYGARGIKICDDWLGPKGALNFYNWSISHGYSDALTIDRVDNDGDYCPENCVWIEKYYNSRDNAPFRKILNTIYDCPCFEKKYIKALIAKIPDKDQRKWLTHELKLKKHP